MSNYPSSSSWGNPPPHAAESHLIQTPPEGVPMGSNDHQVTGGYGGAPPDSFDEARDGGLGWGSGDRSAMYNMGAGWGRPKHKQEVREGDWFCNTCGDHQFARNEYCRSCGAPKGAPPPDPATLEAEYMAAAAAYQMMSAYGMPGKKEDMMLMVHLMLLEGCHLCGLLGAGDWDCPNCGDMNFASRQVCRKCGTPHSFAPPANPEGMPAGPSTGSSSMESSVIPDYSAVQDSSRRRSRSRSRDRRF
ncbi:hypothetical protein FOL47_005972 [Perkinsus chesapeaki]|uniref:RanBP2-type domain-containing protein n=1 Tax=Perkinsus chesapeaki TaxID=330153 RepID=A0A7J6MYK3_PERCH|nr:hypothetical protein FOL47_005972 [Perkinsus chesapeaki]